MRFGCIQAKGLCSGSMKRVLFVILLGSLCVAPAALATTYVRVEKDGTKTYSDRPIPGGQAVVLESAQTYSAPPAEPQGENGQPREQQLLAQMNDFQYESCAVTPKNDETFTNPEVISVGVETRPGLRMGDRVDLRVDGKTVGNTTSTSYALKLAERGTHTVSVQIKDNYGRSLCHATASFHVHRPSLNSPTRRPQVAPRN
jgi:hypothetical protein